MARKELKENELTEDDRLLYQILSDDIRASKADQWRVSNYGLLAQAAVASLSHLVRKNLPGGDAILWNLGFSILSVFICFAAIFLIRGAWGRILDCRKITEGLYPLPFNDDETPPRKWRDLPIIGLFWGAQFIGSILSIIYIFYGGPPS